MQWSTALPTAETGNLIIFNFKYLQVNWPDFKCFRCGIGPNWICICSGFTYSCPLWTLCFGLIFIATNSFGPKYLLVPENYFDWYIVWNPLQHTLISDGLFIIPIHEPASINGFTPPLNFTKSGVILIVVSQPELAVLYFTAKLTRVTWNLHLSFFISLQ